jgi:hypothetical protein
MSWMRHKIHFATAVGLLAFTIGCAHNNTDPRQEAYRKGADAAAQEIAQGNPRLYGIAFAGGPPVDARTGLPITWFSNCLNDRTMETYVRGHNDYVLRHVPMPSTAPNATTRRG